MYITYTIRALEIVLIGRFNTMPTSLVNWPTEYNLDAEYTKVLNDGLDFTSFVTKLLQ